MFLPVFVCLSVCLLARSLEKLWTDLSEILGYVGHGISYQ